MDEAALKSYLKKVQSEFSRKMEEINGEIEIGESVEEDDVQMDDDSLSVEDSGEILHRDKNADRRGFAKGEMIEIEDE